jgi:hypothetical protein
MLIFLANLQEETKDESILTGDLELALPAP